MNTIKEIFGFYPELWLALLSLILSISGLAMIGFGVFISFALIIIVRLVIILIDTIKKK